MSARSFPLPTPQPSEPLYPAARLERFERFTRQTYLDRFGEQAPPWDQNRPIKRWFDSVAGDVNAPDSRVTYTVFDPSQATGVRELILTSRDASTINLPGSVGYPTLVVSDSDADMISQLPDGSTRTSKFPAQFLCTLDQAKAIAAEIGASNVREATTFNQLSSVNWNSETRRPWIADFKGSPKQLSLLMINKAVSGVGSPGHWDLTTDEPAWVSEYQTTGEQDPRPEVQVPIRPLYPNERLVHYPVGGAAIERFQPPPTGMPADVLGALLENTRALCQHFSVPTK